MRILVADDHEAVRKGVCAILESGRDLEVCGEANDGEQAISQALLLQPDVIILDITMPILGGLDAAKQILKFLPGVAILIFSMHESKEMMEEARRIGARGYLTKSDAGKTLLTAVEALTRNESFFPDAAY